MSIDNKFLSEEESVLFEFMKRKARDLRIGFHLTGYYFILRGNKIVFKELYWFSSEDHNLRTCDTFLFYKEGRGILTETIQRLDGIEFESVHLFRSFEEFKGAIEPFYDLKRARTFRSRIGYGKYFRQKNWRFSKLYFFLTIYREFRINGRSKKWLRGYYHLSEERFRRIIADTFDLHCRMRDCVLMPYYLNKEEVNAPQD